ncbi:MAG: hypothetical protein HWE10_02065 [Gammaproteobacteria bacterium]|nr:hypothetical protein [Gammaproteobacteria bacterium]
MLNDNAQQPTIWQQRTNQQLFAELCNALYERELARLSSDQHINLSTLQKRIASMPYYIKRAAEHICDLFTPLDLDSQNGSWISSQSVKPFSSKQQKDKTLQFFEQYAQMALVVPIVVNHSGIEQVVLDSIDEIDVANQRLHCNEHGWFSYTGEQQEAGLITKQLLKPSKPVMSAACCGHQWLNGRRTSPRLLSLREMLLATRINWRQFHKLLSLKK